MPRFVCNHNATAREKIVLLDGRVLTFTRGVLDTDEAGARTIRALPLYGRTILDGDDSAPAHTDEALPVAPELTAEATERLQIAQAMSETQVCFDCDPPAGPFNTVKAYQRHMRQRHGVTFEKEDH